MNEVEQAEAAKFGWSDKPTEGRWVMTSKRLEAPWRLVFYIGAIPIAEIYYIATNKPVLHTWHKEEGPFASIGNAMRRMHQLLKLPPGEA